MSVEKVGKKWRARVYKDGKMIQIGTYELKKDAIKASDEANELKRIERGLFKTQLIDEDIITLDKRDKKRGFLRSFFKNLFRR